MLYKEKRKKEGGGSSSPGALLNLKVAISLSEFQWRVLASVKYKDQGTKYELSPGRDVSISFYKHIVSGQEPRERNKV